MGHCSTTSDHGSGDKKTEWSRQVQQLKGRNRTEAELKGIIHIIVFHIFTAFRKGVASLIKIHQRNTGVKNKCIFGGTVLII